MTDILVFDAPRDAGTARHMAERHVRSFLITATRYLAPGRDLAALDHLESEEMRRLPTHEFDRRLLGVWKNTGK